MTVSRRRFLQSSALAAMGCAASPLIANGAHTKTSTNSTSGTTTLLAPPGRQAFDHTVGQSFQVTSQTQTSPVWLRLLSVNDPPKLSPVNTASMAVPPPKHASRTTAGFVLRFNGGPVENLRQGTYTFENSALGQFSLFIVPSGPQQYTAVFNRL